MQFLEYMLAIIIVGFMVGCVLVIVTLPFFVLMKLIGVSFMSKDRSSSRPFSKDDMIRAQWEHDNMFKRKDEP